uniref:Ribonuclease P/MRP 40 subunit n=1 Tax=Amphilophus citrinellus TaxID=61819 RepID=A0A3Q0R3E3_AMPCI
DLDQTPRTLLVSESSSFLDPKNRVSAQVEQLRFNHQVSVLLPECSSAPSHLDSVLNSFSSFYLIRKLPVYELLDRHFLEAAVYHLSYRTRIDEDNSIALTPNHLTLSLDKDSFELLGFEGKPSRFNHRTATRFVSVDLTDSSMAPGGRGYLRLLTGLTSRLQLQTDFLSLQSLLSRYDWSEHRPEVSCRVLSDLSCPALRSCDPHSLLEWLGAVDAGELVQQLPVIVHLSRPEDDASSRSERVCERSAAATRHPPAAAGALLPGAASAGVLGLHDGSWICQSSILGGPRARLLEGWRELLHADDVSRPHLPAPPSHGSARCLPAL